MIFAAIIIIRYCHDALLSLAEIILLILFSLRSLLRDAIDTLLPLHYCLAAAAALFHLRMTPH